MNWTVLQGVLWALIMCPWVVLFIYAVNALNDGWSEMKVFLFG